MADDTHQHKPAGRQGGTVPILDLAFDSGTLNLLREEVHARACRAGMSAGRAGDVVLAVHELAANAVRHGAGAGRLRMWSLPGALRCQVDDGDPPASGDPGAGSPDGGGPGESGLNSWQARPGHGLWVTRQVADQVQVLSGPDGTRATVTFDLPPGGLRA
jgi:anti-sigma regulatory factor (Ser/Thr protein kinase)